MVLNLKCASMRLQEQQARHVKCNVGNSLEGQDVSVAAVDHHQHEHEHYYFQKKYCQTLKILMNAVDGNNLLVSGSPLQPSALPATFLLHQMMIIFLAKDKSASNLPFG